jgi:Ni/Co efflux regulator RcnB
VPDQEPDQVISEETRYPDRHPDLRDHLVRVFMPGDDDPHEYMPRDQWEQVAKERDEYRRTLAFISVWRLQTGLRDPDLDQLLLRVGEDYDQARATASVIEGVRAWHAARTTDGKASS